MKTVDIIYRYEARDTSARPLPADSNAAVLRLNDGNRNFAALLDHVNNESGIQQIIPVDPRDLGFTPDATETPKQRPFAAVLGCSDARVPIELIFNEGPNDLFIVRVAGGGLGLEVLGSLKYAVEQLGGTLKLIVVLGHSGCGALTMAVDVFLSPGYYLTVAAKHSIRSILDSSLIVVQGSVLFAMLCWLSRLVFGCALTRSLLPVATSRSRINNQHWFCRRKNQQISNRW